MPSSRAPAPRRAQPASELTADLVGIGMNLGVRANDDANVEDAVFFASQEGLERPFCITHAPGHMFVTDLPDHALSVV